MIKIKKGIRVVLVANIVNMLFGVITTFLLPKFLPVEEYASIKTYQLYVTYCGLFHLGYVDAIYLEYGGKNIADISYESIVKNISNMRIFQVIISAAIGLFGIIQKDYLICIFGLTIIPTNMISYFQYVYQAVGEFQKYSSAVKMVAIFNFLGNVITLFLFKLKEGVYYVTLYAIIKIMISMYLEYIFHRDNKLHIETLYFSIVELKNKIKNGFSLMVGNLISEIVTSIDRWFVKYLFSTNHFAQYSFAVNIQSIMNALVTPITLTLYNFLCKNKEEKKTIEIRNYLISFGSIILSSGFIVKAIIVFCLPNYNDSVNVIFILLMAQYFLLITKGIYVNLYKVYKMQKKYMQKIIFVLLGSVLLNIVFIALFDTMWSLALATLIMSVIWLIISDRDFGSIKIEKDKYMYMIILTLIYLICGINFGAILGLCIYAFIIIILNFLFFNKEITKLMKKYLRKKSV